MYLLLASVIFYACWGLPWLILLAAIIGLNYFFGHLLSRLPEGAQAGAGRLRMRRLLFILGICANLAPLIWFKYSWFLIRNLGLLLGQDWQFEPPGLPVGISFYIFIQIAWLTGVYQSMIRPASLHGHALFSSCFPYILSGPIVRQPQVQWQLERLTGLTLAGVASGLTLFVIGLAKKTILADSIGFYADAVFNAADKGWALAPAEAWCGSLAYTFQLYFDFSGYTDMALGIGLFIGLRLPENFNSPYKATGIIDFWRRWHITLSAWLRDYLYIPLGGNRKGKLRQYANLFATMLIGGLWHGAGWTFLIWGAMHGAMLCINHFFRAVIRNRPVEKYLALLPARLAFVLFTFFCLNLCWVVFRALSLDGALAMYAAMFNLGAPLSANGGAEAVADIFRGWFPHNYIDSWLPFGLLCVCLAICWSMPNSSEIMAGKNRFFAWKPSPVWAIGLAALSFIALAMLSRKSMFLYFQF